MTDDYEMYRQLIKEGRFLHAVHFSESMCLKNNNAFWLTQYAQALIKAGNYNNALHAAQQAQQLDSTNLYAVVAEADALMGLHKPEDALPLYREALHEKRLSRRSKRGILECMLKLKKWEDILAFISESGGNETSNIESMYYRVKALVGLKKYDEAQAVCKEWLRTSPDNRSALWELTELEILRDGMDAVLEHMSRLARIPSLPPVYKEIYASLCRRAGKEDLALSEYEKITAETPSHKIQKKRAFTLAKSGKLEEAIPLLEEFLRIEPDDRYLNASYKAACKRSGEVDRAINFYNKLLSLHPGKGSIYGHIKYMKKFQEK
jgi:tetratricopeptide (TPR) repeat protein